MDKDPLTWDEDWSLQIKERINALGYPTLTVFLAAFPNEPYVKLAKRLGKNVTPLQIIHAQLAESQELKYQRIVAIDSLSRILHEETRGWMVGEQWKHRLAITNSRWLAMIPSNEHSNEIKQSKERVWITLMTLTPYQGWLPTSCNDTILGTAFNRGWPE